MFVYNEAEDKIIRKDVIGIILGIIAFILFLGSFYVVQPGRRAFTVTLGAVNSTIYKDGLHLKTPIISDVIKFDVQTQRLDAESNASSKDLQTVSSQISLNYSIDENKVIELYKEIGENDDIEERIIRPAIQEVMKATTAKYTAEELITKRSAVGDGAIEGLKLKLSDMGIKIISLNIVNFDFSAQFNESIEKKVTAEQDALAQKNKLEQVKYEAQQQIEKSKAEAEKIKIQASAIQANGWESYTKLQRIAKWDGKLPTQVLGWDMNMLMQMK